MITIVTVVNINGTVCADGGGKKDEVHTNCWDFYKRKADVAGGALEELRLDSCAGLDECQKTEKRRYE